MKSIFYSIILLCSLNSFLSICNQKNCPKGNGLCKKNQCVCFQSYYSLNYERYKNDTIFCEYKRMSRFGPIILEFFIPSMGHFYAGKMRLFVIKLLIILFPVISYCCGLTTIGQNPDGTQKNISNITWVLLILFVISLVILPFFHICDLICYSFGFYYDGNGVPFL